MTCFDVYNTIVTIFISFSFSKKVETLTKLSSSKIKMKKVWERFWTFSDISLTFNTTFDKTQSLASVASVFKLKSMNSYTNDERWFNYNSQQSKNYVKRRAFGCLVCLSEMWGFNLISIMHWRLELYQKQQLKLKHCQQMFEAHQTLKLH